VGFRGISNCASTQRRVSAHEEKNGGAQGTFVEDCWLCRKLGGSKERAGREKQRAEMGNTKTAQAEIETRRVRMGRDADHCQVRDRDVLK
jgi:hypothetical protein